MTEPSQALYVGAHLFDAGTAARAGAAALDHLDAHAADDAAFAHAMGVSDGALAADVRARVLARLRSRPVDALRVDFEDGYGVHPDADEDAVADRVGRALAHCDLEGPALGVRLKSLASETRARSMHTLERLLRALGDEAPRGGGLPEHLVVCVAKVSEPAQMAFLARQLGHLERACDIPPGTVRLEPMLEQASAVLGRDGRVVTRDIVEAGEGRVESVQFGVYDYTASLGVPASHQHLRHPACDLARGLVQLALAGTGVRLVDGSTAVLPLAPEGADPAAARASVHAGWRRHADDVRHSLAQGWYEGCDLHPTQLASRWAALFAFYREGLEASAARLARFLEKAEQATVVGAQFDDAATVKMLLDYMARAVACGAVTAEEAGRRASLEREDLSDADVGEVLARRSTRSMRAVEG